MAQELTVEEIVPLVQALTPGERRRLLRLITKIPSEDSTIYAEKPPVKDEFAAGEDLLGWDGEGWENLP